MPLPKLTPFNYTTLVKDLKKVKDETRDEATMLNELHEVLLDEQLHNLSAHYGKLEGICMLLETAKGRAESELTEEEVIEYTSQRALAKHYLSVVDKTYFLITQKAKILLNKA